LQREKHPIPLPASPLKGEEEILESMVEIQFGGFVVASSRTRFVL